MTGLPSIVPETSAALTSPVYRPSRRSTFFRLVPTFFTAALDRRVFFASYRTSYSWPPATRSRSWLRPRLVFFVALARPPCTAGNATSNPEVPRESGTRGKCAAPPSRLC
jgi:hypothetical protein